MDRFIDKVDVSDVLEDFAFGFMHDNNRHDHLNFDWLDNTKIKLKFRFQDLQNNVSVEKYDIGLYDCTETVFLNKLHK